MKKMIVCAALAAAAVLSAPVAAQQTSGGMPGDAVTAGHGSFYIGPYVGYIVFGDFDRSEGSTAALSFENKPFYGAQAGYSFSPNFTLVGNLAYSKTQLVVKYDEGATVGLPSGQEVGTFFYDANLQFRLPFVANRVGSTVAPFVQLGAGVFKYTYDIDDLASEGSTNVAFNAGVGVDFQVRKQIGLRLMAKDYITSFGFDGGSDPSISTDDKIANNFAFTAGLNFGF